MNSNELGRHLSFSSEICYLPIRSEGGGGDDDSGDDELRDKTWLSLISFYFTFINYTSRLAASLYLAAPENLREHTSNMLCSHLHKSHNCLIVVEWSCG